MAAVPVTTEGNRKATKVREWALNNVTNTDIWTDERASWRTI